MDAPLFKSALAKYAATFLVVVILLFLPAGTLAW